jgi:hypothetical protein
MSIKTNSREQSSAEANSCSVPQEILCLSENQNLHYHVHNAHYLPLSWTRWIQFTLSHHTFLRYVLIFSHLCLGLQSGPFPSGVLTRTFKAFLGSSMYCYIYENVKQTESNPKCLPGGKKF